MGNKFKAGDWLRSKTNLVGIERGEVVRVGSIARATDAGPWVTVEEKRNHTDDQSYLESNFEPWSPRVGDRVKMIKEVDGFKADCGATVVHNGGGSERDTVIELDEAYEWGHSASGHAKPGYGWWVGVNDIEPLPVAAEAQPAEEARADAGGGFKAGDKIRLLKSAIGGSRTVGHVYEAIERNSASSPASVNFIDDKGDRTWAPGEYFELHKPLQIEAGKFYKARDGRKVGPMEEWRHGGWHSSKSAPPLNGGLWFDDGEPMYPGAFDS
ncbi:MAG: hypothetical protein DI604_33135, partial [Delftia acidovorans]